MPDKLTNNIFPGNAVIVWDDNKLIRRKATIINRYGKRDSGFGNYPDLVDIQFKDRVSKGHFTSAVIVSTGRIQVDLLRGGIDPVYLDCVIKELQNN